MSQCGAKISKDRVCNYPSGEGTVHPGVGRCSLHELTHPVFPFKYASSMVMNEKGYGICRHESELAVFQWLEEQQKDIKGFKIEPCEISYHNHIKNRQATYTPDLLITYVNGINKLAEIKEVAIKHIATKSAGGYKHPSNFDKYIAGINFAKQNGSEFALCLCALVKGCMPSISFIESKRLIEFIDEWNKDQ